MGRSEEFPLLKLYGLKACEIRGDGNCLFNALSDQLYGDQGKNQEIRLNICQYMRENPDSFKPFITVGQGQRRNPKRKTAGSLSSQFSFEVSTEEQTERAWEQHLERMAQSGTYGDNMEIRAFTLAYNTDVRIFQHDQSYYVRSAEDGVTRPVAYIALHTWEHYSSIRNTHGPSTGLPHVQVKALSAEETAKIKAATPKTIPIQDWMIRTVMTSVPHLSVDEATIRKTLEEHRGNIDAVVSKLLDSDYPSSNPPSPGSLSHSGSSSVERDPDSDDDEIYGPNKRQNRRMSRATKALRNRRDTVTMTEPELEPVPTFELTEPDSEFSYKFFSQTQLQPISQLPPATELPVLSTELPQVTFLPKTEKVDDDDEWVAPSDDDNNDEFRPEVEDDARSSYSASSRSQSVSIASTPPPPPPPRTHTKIILRTNGSMQKQHGPPKAPKKKLITARERKELKKAAQKQARKDYRRSNAAHPQLANSTTSINGNRRNSPPMEQVIGMKTLYI